MDDHFFFLPWCKKKGRKRRRRDRRGRKEEGTRRSGGSSWSVEDNPKKDYPPRFEAAPTDPRRISRLKHQTPRGKKGRRRRSKQTRPGRQEGERKKKRGEAPYQNNLLASADCHSNASCCPAQLYLFFLGAALPCRSFFFLPWCKKKKGRKR